MSETTWKVLVKGGVSGWVTFKAKQANWGKKKRKEKDLCLDSVPKLLSWCFTADSEVQLIFPLICSLIFMSYIMELWFIEIYLYSLGFGPNSEVLTPSFLRQNGQRGKRYEWGLLGLRVQGWIPGGLRLITPQFLIFLLEYWLNVRNFRLYCSWRTNCPRLAKHPGFYWWGQYEPVLPPHAQRPPVSTLGPSILPYSPPSVSVLQRDRCGSRLQAAGWESPDMSTGACTPPSHGPGVGRLLWRRNGWTTRRRHRPSCDMYFWGLQLV